MSIYDYHLKRADGTTYALADCRGKVIIIVNTALGCGFSGHYRSLEKWYKAYQHQGLEIIDIPCNQFGNQSPLDDIANMQACQLKYETTFPQMQKADVNGDRALPLYTFLKAERQFVGFGKSLKGLMMSLFVKVFNRQKQNDRDIQWNFTMFVVSRSGQVVARFEPTDAVQQIEDCVVAQIKKT